MEWKRHTKTASREASRSVETEADRRRQARRPLEGEVRLWIDDPAPVEFTGRLVDYSANGFRARHRRAALHSGQEVRFSHSEAEGRARVVWNRILQPHVESGFLILPRR